jgi:hypothetical protein
MCLASQVKKGASLAHGLGVREKVKKVGKNDRDDWDVFHPKSMTRKVGSGKNFDEVNLCASVSLHSA